MYDFRKLTLAMAMRVEKIMGAIQGMPWEGPREVQAKTKRPIVSRGARNRSHKRRT